MGLFVSGPCGGPSLCREPGTVLPTAHRRHPSNPWVDVRKEWLAFVPEGSSWRRHYDRSEASRALLAAVEHGNAILVEQLLRCGLATPDCCNQDSVTPLHAATVAGRADIVKLLVDANADPEPPGAGTMFDGPPAALAASAGFVDCLSVLLFARAAPGRPAGRGAGCGPYGRPRCLHLAAAKGHAACVRALLIADRATAKAIARGGLERAILEPRDMLANLEDETRRLPLHVAVEQGHFSCAALLVQEGFSLLDEIHCDGEAALHGAAITAPTNESVAVNLCILLLENQAEVNCCDADGRTPLHLAAARARLDVCRSLLQHAADVFALDDCDGRNSLHCAARAGSDELCGLLLEALADPHFRDKEHATPWSLTKSHSCGYLLAAAMRRAEEESYVHRGEGDGFASLAQ